MSTVYTVNGKVLKNAANDKWLIKATPVDPYNPLNLPPNTIRVRTSDRNPPRKEDDLATYETATLVEGTTDVYDVYKSGTNFDQILESTPNTIEVLGANTSNITSMYYMFAGCGSLTTVSLFDTSKVTDMGNMFAWCRNLTSIPLFDTSKVTNITEAFVDCYRVSAGALALYQQASTQTNPPLYHSDCFLNCGRDTTNGAAELAQIPSSWGGTGA